MHSSTAVPVAVVDARRLEIALSNLVGNAVRHGDVPIIITLTSTATETIITVDDHGPGISPVHLPHIFDRFYRADGARARSVGSGFGLSLAAENIVLHHGTLTGSSRPGHTTFTLTPAPPPAAGVTTESSMSAHHLGRHDDHRVIVRGLSMQLAHTVHSGVNAAPTRPARTRMRMFERSIHEVKGVA